MLPADLLETSDAARAFSENSARPYLGEESTYERETNVIHRGVSRAARFAFVAYAHVMKRIPVCDRDTWYIDAIHRRVHRATRYKQGKAESVEAFSFSRRVYRYAQDRESLGSVTRRESLNSVIKSGGNGVARVDTTS